MNDSELNGFIEQILSDLGGAFGLGPVRIGATLGLYQTLYKQGALTSAEPADASGLYERYVREWLAYNAASNYVS